MFVHIADREIFWFMVTDMDSSPFWEGPSIQDWIPIDFRPLSKRKTQILKLSPCFNEKLGLVLELA